MASWRELVEAEPGFAQRVRLYLDRHKHKSLATLRRDGSPRISGIEAEVSDQDLWFGSMADSRKVADLIRDPRFALHSGSDDPPQWTGDAKVSGTAVLVTDADDISALTGGTGTASEQASYFRVNVREVVLTRMGEPPDHLVIESWNENRGLRHVTRS